MGRWSAALAAVVALAILWLAVFRSPNNPEVSLEGGEPSAGGVPAATGGRSAESRPGAASLGAPSPAAGAAAEREWAALALHHADARRRSIPIDQVAAIHFQEGEDAMRGGDWDLAVSSFHEFIARDPTSVWTPLAFATIADARLLKGDLESLNLALTQFEDYLEFFPDSDEAASVAEKRDLLRLMLDSDGRLRPDARAALLSFLQDHPGGDPARLAEYLLERIEILGGNRGG